MAELGLTSSEIEGIERTWRIVSTDLKAHGVAIFLALFKKYPEYQSLFKKFKDKPLTEVAKSSGLRAHGSTFMHGLAAMMDSLDDKETLICLVQDNVEKHYKRGIRFQHYTNTLDLMPGYLTEMLCDEMDEEATSGWTKVLEAIRTTMQNKLKELEMKECEK